RLPQRPKLRQPFTAEDGGGHPVLRRVPLPRRKQRLQLPTPRIPRPRVEVRTPSLPVQLRPRLARPHRNGCRSPAVPPAHRRALLARARFVTASRSLPPGSTTLTPWSVRFLLPELVTGGRPELQKQT